MKILARHLTVDFYNCKSSMLQEIQLVKNVLEKLVRGQGYEILNSSAERAGEGHFVVTLIFCDGHIAVHVYEELRYVAMDIFLCREQAEPETVYRELREFFKPDKTKSTLLKRGDFGSDREIKPKTKTRVAPFRKIHNTGAKVIRILARRNRQ